MRMRRFAVICGFEFRRHLDMKGELLGMLLLIVIALVKLAGDAVVTREAASVVYLHAADTPVAGLTHDRFRFLDTGEITASDSHPILKSREDGYSLEIARSPSWAGDLQQSLNVLQRRHILSSLDVSTEELQKADTPVLLQVMDQNGVMIRGQAPLAAVSIAMVVLTMLSILGCLGMLFHGLLAERFASATEMILSATPPGFWLDCKVSAAILHGLKTVTVYGAYALAGWVLVSGSTMGPIHLPDNSWAIASSLLAFCLFGLLLWNWFFAACATMIRSPHSAFRNSLAAFPVTMIMIGFGGLRAPDGTFIQLLSWFPFTSMAAMPVRLLYVDVPAWEVAASLMLLAATAALCRIWARNSFRTAIVSPVETSRPHKS